LIATPGINEFTNLNVTGLATRKNARAEYNEYLNFNPSDLTPIYVSATIVIGLSGSVKRMQSVLLQNGTILTQRS
jgi:hypothetical protein